MEWLDIDPEKYAGSDASYCVQEKMTMQARAADILSVMLADGSMAVSEIHAMFNIENISEWTILNKKGNGNQVLQKRWCLVLAIPENFRRKVRG